MNAAVAVRAQPWRLERVAFAAGAATVGVLAVAACLPGARRFALWQDEVASARVLAEPHAAGMLRHVARTESTPPLWYAVAWLLHRCGLAIVDVRLLSVAAMAALAAGTAVAARRLVPAWAALAAGAAVALGYQFDFHGRELRAYALAALLALLLAVAAERRHDPALAGVVAAGSLTHYFFLFSVAAVLLWRPRAWRPVALGLVPFAAWTPVLARQWARHRFSFIGPFRAHDVLTTYWATFARAQPHDALLHVAAPLALFGAVAGGAVVLARMSEAGRLWALLAVVPVAAAALLWLGGARIYDVRNLVVTGPFAAVAVAAPTARLRRPLALAACSLLLALVGVGFARAARTEPVAYDRIAAALVAEGWHAGDPIVVTGDVYAAWGPLEWYLPRRPTLVVRPGVPARRVFVVAGRGPWWRRVARRAAAVRYVRRTLVARVDGTAAPPGSSTLAAP